MQGFTARVSYLKTGFIRFIGHLDTIRALLRAVRRAGIEGVYSQGFSPRLRLSFGPPLPLGCTSECEFFDIKLAGRCQADFIKNRLQSQLPEGFSVREVEVIPGNPTPPAASFWAAEYEVEFPQDMPPNADDVQRSSRDQVSRDGLQQRGLPEPSSPGRAPESRVVRARWHKRDDGRLVVSIVLRQDPSGKGGLKESISHALGITREALQKCRIHKTRVYRRGEGGRSPFC